MNAGIFLVATQGNIHALSISPKGLIMGMLLAITTCFYGVLPGPLLKKYPAESVCAWAMLIGGGVLAVFLRPWRIEAHLDMIVIVGFLTIVIVGTILPFCLYLAAVKYAGKGPTQPPFFCLENGGRIHGPERTPQFGTLGQGDGTCREVV